MSELENPQPESPAPVETPRSRLSPARWIAGAAVVIAIALFAIPLFLDGPGRASSSEGETSATLAADPTASSGICMAKKAPAQLGYTVKDMHGATVNLTDYKGKVILLNYWATWCGPCKVEIPDLVALQEKYKDQGFVILGVSQDDDPETLRAAGLWVPHWLPRGRGRQPGHGSGRRERARLSADPSRSRSAAVRSSRSVASRHAAAPLDRRRLRSLTGSAGECFYFFPPSVAPLIR